MHRLDGQNILIIHPNAVYFETFIQEVTEAGGFCVGAHTLEEARARIETYSFDLIVTFHTLSDGNALDIADLLEEDPVVATKVLPIGCPQGMEKAYQRMFLEVLDEKKPISTFIEVIYFHLNTFSEDDFDKFIDTEAIESSLYLDKKKYLVETIELTTNSVTLSCSEEFPLETQATLRITIFDSGKFENFVFLCSFKEEHPSGKIFLIASDHLGAWTTFLRKMEKKQTKFTAFLKKASGI